MKKTYTFKIIWMQERSTNKKVIKTFTNQKTKRIAEAWMWNYIKENGFFASEFTLKRIAE